MIKKIFNGLGRVRNLLIRQLVGGVAYARRIGVTVGKDCRILTSYFGTEPFLIEIGNKVTITSGVKLITHDGATWLINDKKGRRYLYRRIKIGNHVFIGVNSIIMPGVIIEDNVIVAAGSVVAKSIPSGKIVGGNPARIIGTYSDFERKVLENYTSDNSRNKHLKYEEDVLSILDKSYKDFILNEYDKQ